MMQNNGKMYYGTSVRHLREIQNHGLLPRNGALAVPITLSFAPYYAVQKAVSKNDDSGIIIEIDLHRCNPYNLVPSADFMEELTKSDPLFAEVHEKCVSKNARIKWFAQRIDRFKGQTAASMSLIGNVGYAGPIPRDACRRMVQFDVRAPYVRRLLGRPVVSPLGFSLMGKYYLQMTRFAFGDELSFEGLHPRLVEAFKDVSRNGIKVI